MRRREFLQSSLGALAIAASSRSTLAQFVAPARTRRILYVLGGFADATPQAMRELVETIGGSSFNVLVLSFLQAGFANGKLALSYNGNAFPPAPQVPALLSRLRSGFPIRRQLLLSIGGWQHRPTFDAIRSFGVPAFVRLLSEQVILPLGLDGIDLDLEPQTGGLDQWMAVHFEHGKTIVDITNEYKRLHPTHIVTHAPISSVAAELYAKPARIAGLNASLLAATRTKHGNNIDWLNVQFYEGGAVDGGDIAGFYCNSLAAPLQQMQSETGIDRPLEFLTPLFEPAAKQPLQFCQQTIRAIDRRCAHLDVGRVNGVALWDYRQVAAKISEWSSGLQSALRGNSGKI
jgi:hypothetical protein